MCRSGKFGSCAAKHDNGARTGPWFKFKHIPIVGFFAACARNCGQQHIQLEGRRLISDLGDFRMVAHAFHADGPNGGNFAKLRKQVRCAGGFPIRT